MARTALFTEQTVENFISRSDIGGLYASAFNFPESGMQNSLTDSFVLEVGETYIVDWDGTEYEVIGQDASALILSGTVVLGNASGFGLSGNNEPFGVICTKSAGVTFVSITETVDSHTIGIYQEAEGEDGGGTTGGESIILKDRNGKDIEYQGIEQLFVKAVSGGTKGFASFKEGELIPGNIAKGIEFGGITGTMEVPKSVEKSVELDFSAGDMEVTPEDGQVFSKIVIPQPANLAPSVIAEGVDIAGIIGTLAAGGGGNVKIAGGSVSVGFTEVNSLTVEHGLGMIPDIILIANGSNFKSTYIIGAFGISTALHNQYASIYLPKNYWFNNGYYGYSTTGIDAATSGPFIHNVTDLTFAFGSSARRPALANSYYWLAIGGLT